MRIDDMKIIDEISTSVVKLQIQSNHYILLINKKLLITHKKTTN